MPGLGVIGRRAPRAAGVVQQHVRHLAAHLGQLLRREIAALLLRHPLEVLQQLTRLDDECGRHVLRRMVLVPVAFAGEPVQVASKVAEGVGHVTALRSHLEVAY